MRAVIVYYADIIIDLKNELDEFDREKTELMKTLDKKKRKSRK